MPSDYGWMIFCSFQLFLYELQQRLLVESASVSVFAVWTTRTGPCLFNIILMAQICHCLKEKWWSSRSQQYSGWNLSDLCFFTFTHRFPNQVGISDFWMSTKVTPEPYECVISTEYMNGLKVRIDRKTLWSLHRSRKCLQQNCSWIFTWWYKTRESCRKLLFQLINIYYSGIYNFHALSLGLQNLTNTQQ